MKQQDDYALEAAERIPSKQSGLLAESIAGLTPRERLLAENAYRRGYCHGYWAGAEIMASGKVKFVTVTTWILRKLSEWRYAKHGGAIVPPPEIVAACKRGEK